MTPHPEAEGLVQAPAHLTLFGFQPTEAALTLRRRSRSWRIGRVLRVAVLTAVAAPLAALVPPHAPWVLGVLGGGLFLARRRWLHRLSVEALSARCPRCDSEVTLPEGTRLALPHSIACEACHHHPTLVVPDGLEDR